MVRANETPTENSITARASRACSHTLGVVRGVPLTLMLMVRPLADGGWLCWVDRRTRSLPAPRGGSCLLEPGKVPQTNGRGRARDLVLRYVLGFRAGWCWGGAGQEPRQMPC